MDSARAFAALVNSSLSGCFSRPQAVVWWRVRRFRNFARIPVEVRDGGSLPTVLDRMPLARCFCVPALWKGAGVRVGKAQALGMLWLSAPSISDGWDHPAQYENAVDGLVLGSLPDDHR